MVEKLQSNYCGSLWRTAYDTRLSASSEEKKNLFVWLRPTELWCNTVSNSTFGVKMASVLIIPESNQANFLCKKKKTSTAQRHWPQQDTSGLSQDGVAREGKTRCLSAGSRRARIARHYHNGSKSKVSGPNVYTRGAVGWAAPCPGWGGTSRTIHKDSVLTRPCRRRCRHGRCAQMTSPCLRNCKYVLT